MRVTPENGNSLDNTLKALRSMAEDPELPQSTTLFAAELSGVEDVVGFNVFLDRQERLALTRGQVSTQSLKPNPVPKSLEPVSFSQRIARSSEFSLWVSRQDWLPGRSAIANLMEDMKLTTLAPVALARGIHKQMDSQTGNLVAALTVSFPVILGIYVGMLPIILQTGESQPAVGILAGVTSYMSFGYSFYHSARENIAPYRQELNKP